MNVKKTIELFYDIHQEMTSLEIKKGSQLASFLKFYFILS